MYRVHPVLLERTLPTMAKPSQNTIRLKTAKRALLENHLLTSQNVQFVVRASIKPPTTHLVHRVHPVLLEPTLPTIAKTSQNTIHFQTAKRRALLEDHMLTSQNVQFVVRASIKTPTTK